MISALACVDQLSGTKFAPDRRIACALPSQSLMCPRSDKLALIGRNHLVEKQIQRIAILDAK
jgi:hypothetical protein